MIKNFLIKKSFIILSLVVFITISTGCKFPDNQIDYKNIQSYDLTFLEFGKTRSYEFKQEYCKDAKFVKVSSDLSYVVTTPQTTTTFSSIRVGFKNEIFDWVEFFFKNDIRVKNITDIYGEPEHINSTHDKYLDYYDYGLFNVSVNKVTKQVRSISLFSLWNENQDSTPLSYNVPKWYQLNSKRILTPGYTTEEYFKEVYPELTPIESTSISTRNFYILTDKIQGGKFHYKNVMLIFQNGLLNNIVLEPRDLELKKFVKFYGTGYFKKTLNKTYDIYDYGDFLILVNKVTNKVENIGII